VPSTSITPTAIAFNSYRPQLQSLQHESPSTPITPTSIAANSQRRHIEGVVSWRAAVPLGGWQGKSLEGTQKNFRHHWSHSLSGIANTGSTLTCRGGMGNFRAALDKILNHKSPGDEQQRANRNQAAS
jgi:hypothetical protein